MQFGASAWVNTITERIQNALAQGNLVPRDSLWDYLGEIDDLLQAPPTTKFVVVAPMGLPVEQSHVTGGGKAYTAFNGVYRVDFCQQLMEKQFTTARLMSSVSSSFAQMVRGGIKLLQVSPIALAPTAAGEIYSPVRQPIRLLDCQFNPRKPATGWGWCRTRWQANFTTDFS